MTIKSILLHNFKKHFRKPDFAINFFNEEETLTNKETRQENKQEQEQTDSQNAANTNLYKLVLVNGRNGSGKSTLCDALCVAFSVGTGGKKTYENKKFELPTDLQPNETVSVQVVFLDDNGFEHNIKRQGAKNDRNNDTWSTWIDGKLIAESKVGNKLAEIGVSGLDNFLVSIHPLFLINPENASQKESLSLFFKLMNESARPKLAEIVNESLKPALFDNPVTNEQEPLFNELEIENYKESPLSILQAIKELGTSNRSFSKELNMAKNEYLVLEKNSKFLNEEELNNIKSIIYNKTNEIKSLQSQIDVYNAKLNDIRFLERGIANDEQTIQHFKDQPAKTSNSATYKKNESTRKQYLNIVTNYKQNYNQALKEMLVKGGLMEFKDEGKPVILNESIKPELKTLKESLGLLETNLTNLLNIYYPLANLDFSAEIAEYEAIKKQKEEQLAKASQQLQESGIDINKLKEQIASLQQEITANNVLLGNDKQEHVKLEQAKANFEHFRNQNLYALKNQVKLTYLNEAKDKCLNAITQYVNSKCKRCQISLYTELTDGSRAEDFKIISKTNGTSYYEMNKAEQWLCGYELANLFQSFNNALLPVMFDGAESIDLIEQTKLIRSIFSQEQAKINRQLFLFNVSYSGFKVSGFSQKEFDETFKK